MNDVNRTEAERLIRAGLINETVFSDLTSRVASEGASAVASDVRVKLDLLTRYLARTASKPMIAAVQALYLVRASEKGGA